MAYTILLTIVYVVYWQRRLTIRRSGFVAGEAGGSGFWIVGKLTKNLLEMVLSKKKFRPKMQNWTGDKNPYFEKNRNEIKILITLISPSEICNRL